jgi:hypothetical protein
VVTKVEVAGGYRRKWEDNRSLDWMMETSGVNLNTLHRHWIAISDELHAVAALLPKEKAPGSPWIGGSV